MNKYGHRAAYTQATHHPLCNVHATVLPCLCAVDMQVVGLFWIWPFDNMDNFIAALIDPFFFLGSVFAMWSISIGFSK